MPRVAKRKSPENKENSEKVESVKKSKKDDAPISKETEKWIPQIAVDFYEKYGNLEPSNDIKNFKFVGPFRKLSGETDVSEIDLMMLDRHALDLPEVQTFMTIDGGRYAFWRDSPKETEVIVVYCEEKDTFPDICVIGDRIEHAFVHMCKDEKIVEKILGCYDKEWEKEMKNVKNNRKKVKIGSAPHEVGIMVELKGGRGYRDMLKAPRVIRSTLTSLKSAKDPKNYMNVINEEFRFMQIANDERDFGMGLELGHWCFLANTDKIDKITTFSLKMAYTLLNRSEFFKILELTMKMRSSSIKN